MGDNIEKQFTDGLEMSIESNGSVLLGDVQFSPDDFVEPV